MNGHRATAADVAAVAGVSRSTVSYILNGSSRLTFSPDTVANVRAAAAALAYTPHAAARALRRGDSGVVLLAIPDMPASSNFAKLVSALTDGVRAADRSLVSLAIRPGSRLVDFLRDISPTALLEVLPISEEDRSAALSADIPVISVAAPIQRLDQAAAALQVQHLAALGHRRLAVVTVDEAGTRSFAESRLSAALAAARDLGLPAPTIAKVRGPLTDATSAMATELVRWTEAPDPVTAVCSFNDMFAGVVAAAARSVGLTVPDDLSIMGIDDEPLAGLLSPTLTTVRYDYAGVGRYIGDQLHHLLDGKNLPTRISGASLELVERDSTAAPRRSDV